MRKKLMLLIIVLIGILSFVGYKSYLLYEYKTQQLDISKGEVIDINNTKKDSNYYVANLGLYLDQYIFDNIDTFISNSNTSTNSDTSIDNTGTDSDTNTNDLDNTPFKTFTINVIYNVFQNTSRLDNKLGIEQYLKVAYGNKDTSLIEKYFQYNNKKLSIIDSSKDIKLKYLIYKFYQNNNILGEVNFLKGLDGLIYKDSHNTYALLFHNNNLYKIEFSNIELDEIKDILSTVNFI